MSLGAAFRQIRVPGAGFPDQQLEQGTLEKRHVPSDDEHRAQPGGDGGMDAAETAQAGAEIGNAAEVGPPSRRVTRVGDEQRRRPEGGGDYVDDPVEHAAAADLEQTFGSAVEPGGGAARQDGPAHVSSGARASARARRPARIAATAGAAPPSTAAPAPDRWRGRSAAATGARHPAPRGGTGSRARVSR